MNRRWFLAMSGSLLSLLRNGKGNLSAAEKTAGRDSKPLPFEQRICRLYFDPMNPRTYDPVAKHFKPREPFHGLAIEELVDIVADIGTEVWSAGVTRNGVWYPSTMVARNKEIPPENLARLTKRCHERNILVLALQQISEPEEQDLEGRMEKWKLWPIDDGRQVKPDKRWVSYVSPFRHWMGRFMAEHIRVGGFDGFWFDATPFANRGIWPWAAGDVGPYGSEAYLHDTGRPVPAEVDWKSQPFREWVQWRYDKVVEFFTAVTATAAKEDPGVAAVMNYYARPNLAWEVAHPLRRLDVNWYPSIETESSILDKVGRALTARTEIWMWAQKYIAELAQGESAYSTPDADIARGLRVLAHGLVPCYGGMEIDIALWKDGIRTTFAELNKRRLYRGGDTVKYAALLISQQTRDFGRETEMLRTEAHAIAAHDGTHKSHDCVTDVLWRNWQGVVEIHNAGHLLCDVIFDDSLTPEGLAPYPFVFLSNAACLSARQCEILRRYVHEGGNLVATQETSLFDEWGNRRNNFALADLFGVDFVTGEGEMAQILVPQTADLKRQFGYLVSFVAPATRVSTSPGSKAEVLFTLSPRRDLNGLGLRHDAYDSAVPTITRRQIGRGTVHYIAADVGQAYLNHWQPQVVDLVCHLERSAAPPPLEIHAPKLLQVTACWQGKRRMVVHLVNCSALFNIDAQKLNPVRDQLAPGEMTPLADVAITITKGQVKRATLPLSGETLAVTDGRINIPVVRHGEVVEVEFS